MSKLTDPILPGTAATDYERYLRTDELLSLQKTPSEMVHRDELLFQTIHQASELWLKLAAFEVETAVESLDRNDVWGAVRLLRRATGAIDLVQQSTMMLEHLAPWDYHAMRPQLGHGSGFDSPGFRRTHDLAPKLGDAFARLLSRRGLDLVACPSCGRAEVDVLGLTKQVHEAIEREGLKVPIRVAVMGCVVNGPGEAREADLGIAAGKGQGFLVVKGEVVDKIPEDRFVERVIEEARRIAAEREAAPAP